MSELENLLAQKKDLVQVINRSLQWENRCSTLKALHDSQEWKQYQVAMQAYKDMPEYIARTQCIKDIKELKAELAEQKAVEVDDS